MQTLPAEVILVANLQVQEYVKVVVGSLEQLPQRLAEVAADGEPFKVWRAMPHLAKLGQLPDFILRRQNLLDSLLQVCQSFDGPP